MHVSRIRTVFPVFPVTVFPDRIPGIPEQRGKMHVSPYSMHRIPCVTVFRVFPHVSPYSVFRIRVFGLAPV